MISLGFGMINHIPFLIPFHVVELQAMADSESEAKPRFIFPTVHENPSGWGPCEVPEQFKDTPYQPFSKRDRLGKVRI